MRNHDHRIALGIRLGIVAAILSFSAFAAADPPEIQTTGYCSASSPVSPTGRQLAMVNVSPREPDVCVRIKLGATADRYVPDCWKVGHALGCTQVVDLN